MPFLSTFQCRRPAAVALLLAAAPVMLAAMQSGTFKMEARGDITGAQSYLNSWGPSSTKIVIRSMPLDLEYFQATAPNGYLCFGARHYEGALTVERLKNGNAAGSYWFSATTNDGQTAVKYHLELFGTLSDTRNWFPAVYTTNTFTATSWRLTTEGKGLGKNSCTGSGSIAADIDITRLD
jgi:hypothetical protein